MYKYLATFLAIVYLFAGALPVEAAPSTQNFVNIQPFITDTYDNGTSSFRWLHLFTKYASTTALTVSGQVSGCAQFDSFGNLTSNGSNCGSTYTATYPVTLTGSAFGLAFGTTTPNTWGALNIFNAGLIAQASSTIYGLNVTNATTTNATTTNQNVSGSLRIASLSGILKAVSGLVTTATADTDYQSPISLTTTGTSGAASFIANVLNIPQYSGGGGSSGIASSTAGSGWTTGNVAVVRDNSSVYGQSTSTPSVTAPITYSGTLGSFVGGVSGAFDCTSASGSLKGCLTSADWTTFNGKLSAAVTSIGPAGQLQIGPAVTMASSSSTTNGFTSALTITGSGNTLTYTPSISGTLATAGGGTGTSTPAIAGQTYRNNGSTMEATSSLTVAANGNVGVGTTTPSKSFSTGGDVLLGGATAGSAGGNVYVQSLASPSVSAVTVDSTGKLATTTSSAGTDYNTGAASKNMADVTGLTQTIAHGLGKTPKRIRIWIQYVVTPGNATSDLEDGVWTSNGNYRMYGTRTNEGGSSAAVDCVYNESSGPGILILALRSAVADTCPTSGPNYQAAVISAVDATNITLTWTKSGTPIGTLTFYWEASD